MKVKSATVFLISLFLITAFAIAQSSPPDQSSAQETQASGYWVDPSTGLMWAAKDNGQDINWKKAVKYCRDLRLAGYSDWRLASVDELQGIYDGSGFTAPHPKGWVPVLAGRAKGGLLLTGNHEWSSTKGEDDRGHSNGYAWYFDFPHGKKDWDPYGYHGGKRALCVRRSGSTTGHMACGHKKRDSRCS